MFKVEFYKITRSLNLLFLFLLVVGVALFLGINISKHMDVNNTSDQVNIVFISSVAVLMLYIMVLASLLINREYISNNYRTLVGIGIMRQRIIAVKYTMFMFIGLTIVTVHAAITILTSSINTHVKLDVSQLINISLYMLVYASFISIIFLLSTITKDILKSIILNILFIVSSGIVLSMSGDRDIIPIVPIQLLKIIENEQNNSYIIVIFTSLSYIVITYTISRFVFIKQEL